ncbi:MAG: DUF4435 domain-containing protein [Lachnospiraceae bacterium]|nr:DUF4435 domain-containing protein [Lachnospiraceae bacterium]
MAYGNQYMHRTGARAASAMRIRNEYSKQYGIQYYLLVEGESDEHFFENILDCKICKVVNLDGKENVLNYIEEQNRLNKKGYLAIVDADFEHITRRTSTDKNVILTDVHDMEMLILSSKPNMRRLYSELTDNIIIQNFEESQGKTFIDSIIDASYELGLLKLVCGKNKYRINMQDIPYADVVDDKFMVNIEELVNRVRGRYTAYEISTDVDLERKKQFDRFQVGCGHDVTNILAMSVVSTDNEGLGYGRNKNVNKNRIEEMLRVIYDFDKFKLTSLYKSIIKWEEDNGIRILDRNILEAA